MLVSALVAVVCTTVAAVGIRAEWVSGLVGPAVAGATVGTVALLAGSLAFPPYVETRIDRHRIELRYVFRPRRVVPAEDIDEIVVLQRLQIPGRFASVTTPRVLLRGGGRVLAAYTPHRQGAALQELAPLAVEPQIALECLTPEGAHRRYPGSVTSFERAMSPASLLAVLVGLGVLIWALAEIL
jgi:hypothetical protein